MRLDRYLANAGLGTRKEVKKLIRDGRIRIDTEIAKDFSRQVDFNNAIFLDNQRINYKEFYYILLNKPQGYISATYDDVHKVVLNLMPDFAKYKIAPVGRLDIDTTGVMLLTNNGDLAHSLLSPKKHVSKEYLAEVNHPLKEDLIPLFAEGVTLEDNYKCMPAKLEFIDNFHAKLTINEGKFHQVKRMFKAYGYEVITLERTKFDFLTVGNLKPGEYRELSSDEIERLLQRLK